MKPSIETLIKLSVLALLIYLMDGLQVIGLLIQVVETLWLTNTLLKNSYINKNTWSLYVSVGLDGAILGLMCICMSLSPAPFELLLIMGILTMVKQILHRKEIGEEIEIQLNNF